MTETTPLKVAIAGLGAIGLPVSKALDRCIEGLELVAVSARDKARAADKLAGLSKPPPVVSLGELAEVGDIVIESIPAISFADVAEPAIDAGRIFMPLSVGVLLSRMDLVDRAKQSGARIIVPTGALLGLDAVRAAAEGNITSVTMVTRKPPKSLKGAPHIEAEGVDVEAIDEPTQVFKGNALAAAKGFPANINVGAALSLAGVGPERTAIEIWADPTVSRNTHRIKVEADAARFEMTIEGVPTEENPATGKLTPLSVIATLRGLVSPLRVGS